MGKRYYWLKLPDDFFRQKPIKKSSQDRRGRYLYNHLSENAAYRHETGRPALLRGSGR